MSDKGAIPQPSTAAASLCDAVDSEAALPLVDRLKAIPKGTKLTLVLSDIFGSPFDYQVTTTGEVRHHGYFTPGGGWGLYKHDGDIECFEIAVVPYRKRRGVWMKIGTKVKDFRLGWRD